VQVSVFSVGQPQVRLSSLTVRLESLTYLCNHRVDLVGMNSQILDGLRQLALIELLAPGQLAQGRQRDALGVDLEVPPQVLASFAAAQAVGAQGGQSA